MNGGGEWEKIKQRKQEAEPKAPPHINQTQKIKGKKAEKASNEASLHWTEKEKRKRKPAKDGRREREREREIKLNSF